MKANKLFYGALFGILPLASCGLDFWTSARAAGFLFSLFIVSLYFFSKSRQFFPKNFFRLSLLLWTAAWSAAAFYFLELPLFFGLSLLGLLYPIFFEKTLRTDISRWIPAGALSALLIGLLGAARQYFPSASFFAGPEGTFLVLALGFLILKKAGRYE